MRHLLPLATAIQPSSLNAKKEIVANHGRRTSTRPGHHRPFICFQAGSSSPEPGRSAAASRGQCETSLCCLLSPFLKSWLPSRSLRGVMFPGWVERRVHILFIWLNTSHPPLRFRRFSHFIPGPLSLLHAGVEPQQPRTLAHNSPGTRRNGICSGWELCLKPGLVVGVHPCGAQHQNN